MPLWIPAALLQAIKFDEKNALALSRLSGVYLAQGKGDEAVEAMQRWVGIAPASAHLGTS